MCMLCVMARVDAPPPGSPSLPGDMLEQAHEYSKQDHMTDDEFVDRLQQLVKKRDVEIQHLEKMVSHFKTGREEMYHKLKDLNESLECKICLAARACIMIIPCGHLVICDACTRSVEKCPHLCNFE
jgi:hypothetical protein